MKEFDSDKVADIVADVLGRDFEKIKILKVNVAPDQDRDALRPRVLGSAESPRSSSSSCTVARISSLS